MEQAILDRPETMTSPQAASTVKLLAVSFCYPPFASPRAVQVARLLRHTNAETVLVCADEEGGRRDETVEPRAEEFLAACLRVPFATPAWRRQVSRVASRFNLPLWNRAPDQYGIWKGPALSAIEAFMRDRSYVPDALITFGQPMSDHLIGLELSRRHRIPWIVHFSDPWIDNPLGHFDPLTKSLNASFERKIIERANSVLFTSEETLDLVMKKYPPEWKRKACVLQHAFDSQLYPATSEARSARITLRHLGELYGRRSPKPLFDALRLISASDPPALKQLKIELVGPIDEATIKSSGLQDLPVGIVELKPTVKYLESLALMESAEGLLVLDAPAERSVFLPSKLIDYMGSGRPIFGITPPGTSANLIQELGGRTADPLKIQDVAHELIKFLTTLRSDQGRSAVPWGESGVRARYDAGHVGREFELIIRKTTSAVAGNRVSG